MILVSTNDDSRLQETFSVVSRELLMLVDREEGGEEDTEKPL